MLCETFVSLRHDAFFSLLFLFTLFSFTILYWFCHTLTWICHGCTWVPNPEPPSHLPWCFLTTPGRQPRGWVRDTIFGGNKCWSKFLFWEKLTCKNSWAQRFLFPFLFTCSAIGVAPRALLTQSNDNGSPTCMATVTCCLFRSAMLCIGLWFFRRHTYSFLPCYLQDTHCSLRRGKKMTHIKKF